MSEQQPTELPSSYLSITCDAAPSDKLALRVRINDKDPDIITLIVGGMRISTVRENWARIFNEFAATVTDEIVEVTAPKRTFRIDFNDTDRTAHIKAVAE